MSGERAGHCVGACRSGVNAIVRTIAQPSLTQLVLRLALAVPFWRSGVNKWDGFLQLNEMPCFCSVRSSSCTCPGGPYPFPAPALMAFAAGSAEIVLPVLLVLGLATRFAATAPDHDDRRAAHRARRLATPPDLGGDGARDHGLGAGACLHRSLAVSLGEGSTDAPALTVANWLDQTSAAFILSPAASTRHTRCSMRACPRCTGTR